MGLTTTKVREPIAEKVTSTMFRSWWGTLKHSTLWCNKLNSLVLHNYPRHIHIHKKVMFMKGILYYTKTN